jgi:hypothetical protein
MVYAGYAMAGVPAPCVGVVVEGVEEEERGRKKESYKVLTQDSGREMSRQELPKTGKTITEKSNRSAEFGSLTALNPSKIDNTLSTSGQGKIQLANQTSPISHTDND